MFLSCRWYGDRDVGIGTVEHLHSMWTALGVDASHDQTGDHDKQADYYQRDGYQLLALEPAARGQLQEARRRDDEDQGCGAQSTLNGGRRHQWAKVNTEFAT